MARYFIFPGEDVADTGVAVAQRTSNGFLVGAPCLGIIDLGAAIVVWVNRRLGLVGFAVGLFSRGIFPRHPSRALLQFGDGRNVGQVVEAELRFFAAGVVFDSEWRREAARRDRHVDGANAGRPGICRWRQIGGVAHQEPPTTTRALELSDSSIHATSKSSRATSNDRSD